MNYYNSALAYYENRQYQEARGCLYEHIKEVTPDNDILLFLGILELHLGQVQNSLKYLNESLSLNPFNPITQYNVGICFFQLKEYDSALYHFTFAIQLDELNFEAFLNRGLTYLKLKEYESAEKDYQKALNIKADNPEVLNNLGNLKLETMEYLQAISYFKQAALYDPRNPDIYYNLGTCCLKMGDLEKAKQNFENALNINKNHLESLNNLGIIYTKSLEFDKAEQIYKQIIDSNPDNNEAYFNLGYCYQNNDQYEKSIEFYKIAFDRNSETKGALVNIGNMLDRLGKTDESDEYFTKAIGDANSKSITFTNLGIAKFEQGKVDEAIDFFDKALSIAPDVPEIHYNKAHALLLQGKFEEGWKEYEWRLKRKDFEQRSFTKPFLTDKEILGKTILVYHEQGLGDSIQFIRYLALLKEAGATVFFETDIRLNSLFSNIKFIDSLLVKDQYQESNIQYDFHIPLLSLPAYFETKLETIPCSIPYIKVSKELTRTFYKLIGDNTLYKVGLVWSGNPKHTGDKKRSCSLNNFIPLFSLTGVKFYSLQKNFGREQLEGFNFPLTDLDSYLSNFEDTAAAISCLDLIITVDTSVAHLAGAMGKKVWLLIPYISDWRWMLDRIDTPWYPNVELFRQKNPRDWESVFKPIYEGLEYFIEKKIADVSTLDAPDTVYLGLTKGENFGWGICSKYLKRELSKLVKIVNIDEHKELLEYNKLQGKIFHALTDVNFCSLYVINGAKDIGYVFFENELNQKSIDHSKEFDLVLAGSTWCRDKMLEAGITNTDILLQGIDHELFYPSDKKKSSDLFVVFSGGKFEYRKGQDIVLKAIKILQQKYKDIILVNAWYNLWPASILTMNRTNNISFDLQGNTWDAFMKNIYAKNGLDESKFITLPLVSNFHFREIYQKTDIGIFPNRCEGGTNLVLMEYMACGRPAIVSNTSGHKDVVNENNSLLLKELKPCKIYDTDNNLVSDWVDPDVDELVSQLEFAYWNRDHIRDIGNKAASDMKTFTWENSARHLLKYLDIV